MGWQPVVICVFLAAVSAAPARAADERTGQSGPFSLHLGLGSHLTDGGDLQSLSFGYGWRNAALLVNVERNHVPTRERTFPGGGSLTRGGTLTSVSGEFRYTVPAGERVSPFVMAGLGGGVSRPTVNQDFPDVVSNTAKLSYFGGGVRVRLRPSLEVCADARVMLVMERDTLGARYPIRGGLTWRF